MPLESTKASVISRGTHLEKLLFFQKALTVDLPCNKDFEERRMGHMHEVN